MTFRIRCEVLRCIALSDDATSESVAKMLPELKSSQIQKAIYQLLTQDRIFKVRQLKRQGSKGRALFVYEANEEWEPTRDLKQKRDYQKSYSSEIRTNGIGFTGVIRFRDRKIRMLLRIMDKVGGANKDLLIGILSDYGHKYSE